jgi:phosphoglycerate dehydrogenase-like enzyme
VTFTITWVDPQPEDEVAFGQGLLPDGFTLVADPYGRDGDAWPELARAADALVFKAVPVDADVLAAAPAARLVQKYGGREDGADLEAAAAAGVAVATMPLRGCIAVAELAMTLMLAVSKQLVVGHAATASGAYRDLGLEPRTTSQASHGFQWMKLPGLFEVGGRTLGIVGFGEIGTEVARRARAFAMDVVYTKRTPLPPAIEQRLGVAWRPLDALLAEADVVLLAAPHTPQTERIIDAAALARMRPSAVLVNVSRGGLVDEAALVEALHSGRIAGAGLDVFVQEPVPYDHPLLTLDNVVLSPHLGGGTGGAREKQLRDVLDNVVRVGRGEAPLHLVQGGPVPC